MAVFHFDCHPTHEIGLSSLTDLRKKLFPKKDDLHYTLIDIEEKYNPAVLIGNWFERRSKYISFDNDWKTVYKQDYKFHDTNICKETEDVSWDNKLNIEGLSKSLLMDHHDEKYYNNMTSTYDLSYRILPQVSRTASASIPRKKWTKEEDLTKNFGNLTQFGLKEALQNWWDNNSTKAMLNCHWQTSYCNAHNIENVLFKQEDKRFHKRRVNMNLPDLCHLKRNERCHNEICHNV